MENEKDNQQENIRFAVFDGGNEITPQMYEEVKNFVDFVQQIKE